MLWALLAVGLLAAAALVWLVRRFNAGGDDLEKEINELGLLPLYDELRRKYDAKEISFEEMLTRRRLELRKAQLRKEILETPVLDGQVAVLQPQTDDDRWALDALAAEGLLACDPQHQTYAVIRKSA